MLLATALTSQSVHSYCPEEVAFRDGFFGGVTLGGEWTQEDWSGISSIALVDDFSGSGPKTIFDTSIPRGRNKDNGNFVGSVALGYQLVDCRLYLGAQIVGTFRPQTVSHLNDFKSYSETIIEDGSTLTGSAETHTRLTIGTSEFDADLKPGVLLCPNFLVYALGGVAVTHFKLENFGKWTENGDEPEGPALITLEATSASRPHKTIIGFRAGAGMEYLITNYLGISLDYIFTDYGKIRAVNFAADFSPLWNSVYGIHAPEIKVMTHSVKAGIVFHY